jgi:hypothetical protein
MLFRNRNCQSGPRVKVIANISVGSIHDIFDGYGSWAGHRKRCKSDDLMEANFELAHLWNEIHAVISRCHRIDGFDRIANPLAA